MLSDLYNRVKHALQLPNIFFVAKCKSLRSHALISGQSLEQESEGREVVLGTLFKLLVKDKLLYSGKVPVNAELRPLRRETRNGSSTIWHFERDDEGMTE